MSPLVTAGPDKAPPFLRKEPVNQPKFHSASDEERDNVKGLTDRSEEKDSTGGGGKGGRHRQEVRQRWG